jgi:hypothetical protein
MHGARVQVRRGAAEDWIKRDPDLGDAEHLLQECDAMSGGQENSWGNQRACAGRVFDSGSQILGHNGTDVGMKIVVESAVGDTTGSRRAAEQCES